MDEDVRKKGMLYIQQQRFGKKWKKVWSVIYRESACSISRMEFFECKDAAGNMEKADRTLRKSDNKKVIRLSDCIRVSEVEMEGGPKDCGPFLVETTEKLFLFAAEHAELEDWIQKLCEIAFPMNWSERGATSRGSVQRGHSRGSPPESAMEDNSLYSRGDYAPKDFKVGVRKTEASERCRIRGCFILRADLDSLILMDQKAGEVLFTWPYRFLRRFGRDKVTFSFEAGRRCDTGEGNFEFDTRQGNRLFQAVEKAINLQKHAFAPHRQVSGGAETVAKTSSVYSTIDESPARDGAARTRLGLPADKVLTGVKSLTLDTRPLPRKNQVKNIASCPLLNSEDQAYSRISSPQEPGESVGRRRGSQGEYSLPFDAVGHNLMASFLAARTPVGGALGCERDERADGAEEEAPDPLYDSIDESTVRAVIEARADGHGPPGAKVEHIYDEPEGRASAPTGAFYDDPEEVRGHAWRLLGAAGNPSGHEYPYNPNIDDYAVPKPPERAFPAPRGAQLKDDEDDSAYDNVILKATDRDNR